MCNNIPVQCNGDGGDTSLCVWSNRASAVIASPPSGNPGFPNSGLEPVPKIEPSFNFTTFFTVILKVKSWTHYI